MRIYCGYQFIRYNLLIWIMCQCVLCDCWWCNVLGVCCAGWHIAYCCMSCWVCRPDGLQNQDCCICCKCTGLGENFLCCGSVCCSPDYLKQWSNSLSGGQGSAGSKGTNTQLKWSIYIQTHINHITQLSINKLHTIYPYLLKWNLRIEDILFM